MLPRLENFIGNIFTPGIVVYNESFVLLGKKPKIYQYAVQCPEGVTGQSKDVVIFHILFFGE